MGSDILRPKRSSLTESNFEGLPQMTRALRQGRSCKIPSFEVTCLFNNFIAEAMILSPLMLVIGTVPIINKNFERRSSQVWISVPESEYPKRKAVLIKAIQMLREKGARIIQIITTLNKRQPIRGGYSMTKLSNVRIRKFPDKFFESHSDLNSSVQEITIKS